MRGIFVAASIGALFAGCGSASTGTACSNQGANMVGLYGYVKQEQAHGVLSPSEQQARANLQHEVKEASADCERKGLVTTLPHPKGP